jgi:hypothetical protein
MRFLFILLLSVAGTGLLAQTKEIAFKSHSGNSENFKTTINSDLFDNEDGGFGLPAPTKVKSYKLDSVFYVSDTVSVIVIREYERKDFETEQKARLVATRKDTLYRDSLLGNKHQLNKIKTSLGQLGYYTNPVNETVFVGYDNKDEKKKKDKNKEKENKELLFPATVISDPGNSPFDDQLLLMLGAILALSLLGGWISWRFYQPKLQ